MSAGAPGIQDAFVTGHDRDDVGLLVFINAGGCGSLCGTTNTTELAKHPNLQAHLRDAFSRFNAENHGSSRRIARLLIMTDPPSIDGNEITDKGYINQRAVLERRAALVARLYAGGAQPDVIVIDTPEAVSLRELSSHA
jgi:feruloyl-CoA synthase